MTLYLVDKAPTFTSVVEDLNQSPNPSFELTVNGVTPQAGCTVVRRALASVAYSGGSYMRVTGTTTAPTLANAQVIIDGPTITPGDFFACEMRVGDDGVAGRVTAVRVVIGAYTLGGVLVGSELAGPWKVVTPGSLKLADKLLVSGRADAGATAARVRARLEFSRNLGALPPLASFIASVDGIKWRTGAEEVVEASIGPYQDYGYFDGSTPGFTPPGTVGPTFDPGTVGVGYRWQGTPQESVSEMLRWTMVGVIAIPFSEQYSAVRDGRVTTHDVIGRAEPVVFGGTRSLRTGTIRYFALSYADALAIDAFHNRGVVRLIDTEYTALGMLYVARDVTVTPDATQTKVRVWHVDVTYVEVLS